jgi:hypothetical protein
VSTLPSCPSSTPGGAPQLSRANDAGEPLTGLAHSVQAPDQKVDGDLLAGGRVEFTSSPKGNYAAKLNPITKRKK